MDLQLTDRIALVTAASQGLGFATARQLSREGALVAICSRNDVHLQAAADAIRSETGKPVLAVAADVTSPEAVQGLIDRVVEEYGGLDILIANSGGPPPGKFEAVTDDMWRAAVDQLLMSTVYLIRSALPHLRQSTVPSVIAYTGLAAKQPIPNLLLSNSVRMAVVGLIKTLSHELGSEGIRFNSIMPGWVETERIIEIMQNRSANSGRSLEEEYALQNQTIPFGRMATPEEFGMTAAFLASPVASYISGLMLNFDGGSLRGVY